MTCAILRADASHSGCLRGAFAFWGRGSAGPSSSRLACATAKCRRASDHVCAYLLCVCLPFISGRHVAQASSSLGNPRNRAYLRRSTSPLSLLLLPIVSLFAEVLTPHSRKCRAYREISKTVQACDSSVNRFRVGFSRRQDEPTCRPYARIATPVFPRRAVTSTSGARARRSARDRNPNVCAAVVVVPDVRCATVCFGDHAHDRKP